MELWGEFLLYTLATLSHEQQSSKSTVHHLLSTERHTHSYELCNGHNGACSSSIIRHFRQYSVDTLKESEYCGHEHKSIKQLNQPIAQNKKYILQNDAFVS